MIFSRRDGRYLSDNLADSRIRRAARDPTYLWGTGQVRGFLTASSDRIREFLKERKLSKSQLLDDELTVLSPNQTCWEHGANLAG